MGKSIGLELWIKMYKKLANGSFEVESRSNRKMVWHVSANRQTCDCPKFKYILKCHGPCHHIEEVIKGDGPTTKPDIGKFPTWDREKYKTPISEMNFIGIFGEEQFDYLVKIFEVILINKLVRKL